MKEVKPILVIKVPIQSYSQHDLAKAHEDLNKRGISDDYHILIVSNGFKDEVDIEVFYDKDIKETQIEQLKKDIKDGWNN